MDRLMMACMYNWNRLLCFGASGVKGGMMMKKVRVRFGLGAEAADIRLEAFLEDLSFSASCNE